LSEYKGENVNDGDVRLRYRALMVGMLLLRKALAYILLPSLSNNEITELTGRES